MMVDFQWSKETPRKPGIYLAFNGVSEEYHICEVHFSEGHPFWMKYPGSDRIIAVDRWDAVPHHHFWWYGPVVKPLVGKRS